MSASVYERKSHLKKKLYSVERSRERCASNNLSHDNENLLVAAFFFVDNFELLGKTLFS